MTAKLVNVEPIGSYFQPLPDPRHARDREHLLIDVVAIAVRGMGRGRDGVTAIHRWAANRVDRLKRVLTPPNGAPSRDRLRRLLVALGPRAFRECFRGWIAEVVHADEGGPARLAATDGETCRRSHDAARGPGPPHLVSAWASQEGTALGHAAADQKSNEITAIPLLLRQTGLTGTAVTIDAIGRQKEAARDVVGGGGDFVIAVKGNPPKPREAIEGYSHEHLEQDFEEPRYRRHETSEEGHGRAGERAYYLTEVPPGFAVKKEWPWVKAVGYSARVSVGGGGRETSEVRHFILSRYLSGKRFSEAVRGHWSIGSMRWGLGVAFREDDGRTRERTLGNDLSWLRRFAITLLKRHPIKDSLRGKMIRSLMNTNFLTEVLTFQ